MSSTAPIVMTAAVELERFISWFAERYPLNAETKVKTDARRWKCGDCTERSARGALSTLLPMVVVRACLVSYFTSGTFSDPFLKQTVVSFWAPYCASMVDDYDAHAESQWYADAAFVEVQEDDVGIAFLMLEKLYPYIPAALCYMRDLYAAMERDLEMPLGSIPLSPHGLTPDFLRDVAMPAFRKAGQFPPNNAPSRPPPGMHYVGIEKTDAFGLVELGKKLDSYDDEQFDEETAGVIDLEADEHANHDTSDDSEDDTYGPPIKGKRRATQNGGGKRLRSGSDSDSDSDSDSESDENDEGEEDMTSESSSLDSEEAEARPEEARRSERIAEDASEDLDSDSESESGSDE